VAQHVIRRTKFPFKSPLLRIRGAFVLDWYFLLKR
jgi:hypothetical protein